jgi:lysophospholipase L1-like esterase
MRPRLAAAVLLLALWAACPAARPAGAAAPSFEDFDRRAREGEHLSVVFFGASLTWGANASDPQLTSYRALVGQRLEAAYPKARFNFHDAAIGGTGSQLGVFRLGRDVLARKPDLVFLDFSANDDIYSASPETLASYEAIVRRIITEGRAPVVIAIFPFMWNVASGSTDGMKRREAHLQIAKAYNVPAGDAISLAIERVKAGATTIQKIWPVDGVHPCDEGYAVFADAAWAAFQDGVRRKAVCAPPEKMLFAPTYMKSARVRVSALAPLPKGWRVGRPNVVSAFFDMLMSRWLDDETVASRFAEIQEEGKKEKAAQEVGRLRVRFSGQVVLVYGESTPASAKFRARIDGRAVEHKPDKDKPPVDFWDAGSLARMVKGNTFLAVVIAEGLDPAAEHTLEIEPLFKDETDQELRFESICVAGGEARVAALPPE